jgi:hypothetical protein
VRRARFGSQQHPFATLLAGGRLWLPRPNHCYLERWCLDVGVLALPDGDCEFFLSRVEQFGRHARCGDGDSSYPCLSGACADSTRRRARSEERWRRRKNAAAHRFAAATSSAALVACIRRVTTAWRCNDLCETTRENVINHEHGGRHQTLRLAYRTRTSIRRWRRWRPLAGRKRGASGRGRRRSRGFV